MPLQSRDLLDTSWTLAMKGAFSPVGPVQGLALKKFIVDNMQATRFKDLKIPLVIVATDIKANRAALLRSGPIAPAVHASSAMPPFFSPVHLYQTIYIDGGVIAPVPVKVAKQFNPKLIIAVDISKPPSISILKNAIQLTNRALDISFYKLAASQASEADIVIHPDLMGFGTFEDQYNQEFYLAGRKSALAMLDSIKHAVARLL